MIKNTEPWVAYAICSSVGTEMFYPEPGEDWKPSTELCLTRCRVTAQCLDFAMRMECGPHRTRRARAGLACGGGGMKPAHRTRNPSEMDKALDENPPQIVWRTTKGGIKIAVSVMDPHAEGPNWKCRNDPAEPYLEYLDILAVEEARETEDSPLLKAARKI